MKEKVYVVNRLDIMQVEGIYDIRNISDSEIAKLAEECDIVNRGDSWMYGNLSTGEIVFVTVPGRPSPEPLDLTKEVFCKILLIQESGNKLIQYATTKGETPGCIYFP